ncbi:hypothetical protein BCR35DRAFT_355178 [Leucosporidium creatinivorum]|uniref:Uncharacterized protein n=1 Tax=Leucosporidium creatinivorum TaxID=106004 RepID=A0A1Y2DPS5_9BASI|nr:hypothetical protein BCR35DRAFT_355178 [Leucosporidium creatinivorum]
MRAVSLLVAAALAFTVSAKGNHQNINRSHLRKQRAWGRRDLDSSLAASATITDSTNTLPTAVPDVVTGAITISNTEAADPQATASAVGADRGDTSPLPACPATAAFGAACDPTSSVCCQTGLSCVNKKCARLCPITTTEAYCDADFPCDSTMGYVCTNSRCRPPATATRVGTGETCDQGGANTLFCIPAKGLCVSGVCQPCTQHA